MAFDDVVLDQAYSICAFQTMMVERLRSHQTADQVEELRQLQTWVTKEEDHVMELTLKSFRVKWEKEMVLCEKEVTKVTREKEVDALLSKNDKFTEVMKSFEAHTMKALRCRKSEALCCYLEGIH